MNDSTPPPPEIERALRLVFERLGVQPSPDERRELARLLDRDLGFSETARRMKTAAGLVAQIEKHLDPFGDRQVKLWKRIFIDEMLLHARETRRLLGDDPELG